MEQQVTAAEQEREKERNEWTAKLEEQTAEIQQLRLDLKRTEHDKRRLSEVCKKSFQVSRINSLNPHAQVYAEQSATQALLVRAEEENKTLQSQLL